MSKNPEVPTSPDSVRDALRFTADQETISKFKAWFEVVLHSAAESQAAQQVIQELVDQGWLTFSIDARLAQAGYLPSFRIFLSGIVDGIHQNIELRATAENTSVKDSRYTVTFRTQFDQEVFLHSMRFLDVESSNDVAFTDAVAAYLIQNYQTLLLPPQKNFDLRLDE